MFAEWNGTRADREAPAGVRRALASRGDPLPDAVRRRVGGDFSQVRVHSDESAREIGAAAYTVGDHVVFAPGRYAPNTGPGLRLLMHELTHVAQQRQARHGARLPVGRGDDAAEREADAMADKAMSGGRISGVAHGRTAEHVVRRDDEKKRPDPHYPTDAEQKEIEKALRRKRTTHVVAAPRPAGAAADPADVEVVQGRVLTAQKQREMVDRLRAPLLATIRGLKSAAPGDTTEPAAAFPVVDKARTAVFEYFAPYLDRTFTLTRDETLRVADRRRSKQVLVTFTSTAAAAEALAKTVADKDCVACQAAFADLSDGSKNAVRDTLVAELLASNGEDLRKAAVANVGGSYNRDLDRVNIPLSSESVFDSSVHELIHALAHPAFTAAFEDERNIVEGFTEYFTRQVITGTRTNYEEFVGPVRAVKGAMTGPFTTAIDAPSAEESLRLAYFKGRLDLIGWVPSERVEREKVAKALPEGTAPPVWDAKTAAVHEKFYETRAVGVQAASRNVLGVGLYFAKQTGDEPTITVRYARVLARTEPYAKLQLLAEGQLLGAPVSDPKSIGASLGVAGEYQEPYFFLTGGARFVGTAAQGGSNRLDISPFVGGGIRAWQTVRVGAEGFVLLPVAGEGIRWGGGFTLGVEFR